jgi:hypothetical protein
LVFAVDPAEYSVLPSEYMVVVPLALCAKLKSDTFVLPEYAEDAPLDEE